MFLLIVEVVGLVVVELLSSIIFKRSSGVILKFSILSSDCGVDPLYLSKSSGMTEQIGLAFSFKWGVFWGGRFDVGDSAVGLLLGSSFSDCLLIVAN